MVSGITEGSGSSLAACWVRWTWFVGGRNQSVRATCLLCVVLVVSRERSSTEAKSK